jgi:hypothetical protein
MVAQSCGSVKVLVQPLKPSFEAMATLFFSSLCQSLEKQLSAPAVSSSI